jgi:hypothetical protein
MEIVINKGKKKKPLKIGFFGQGGSGKSTAIKDALIADKEGGLNEIDCESVDLVGKSTEDLYDFLRYVHKHHKDIKQDTIAIDSIDWVEKQIHTEICADKGVTSGSINEKPLSFGVGHGIAMSRFKKLYSSLDMVRDIGFNIAIISHAKIQRVSDPNLDEYDRWDLALERNIRNYTREWLDILCYVSIETFTVKQESSGFGGTKFKPTTTGRRLLNVGNDPSYESKTRIPLPDKMDLDWGVLMSAIEKSRADQGDTAKEEPKKKEKKESKDGTDSIRL